MAISINFCGALLVLVDCLNSGSCSAVHPRSPFHLLSLPCDFLQMFPQVCSDPPSQCLQTCLFLDYCR
ncbi:hypothetical protein O6H91_14G075000 [Diphasiastrum complanatum]|uniref:Uncharacterized protein n=1 Tax=Diphasiastrum complanatum TaxID=34168 RepID=A0ACC2BQU1_DIPCM|nr:hypothetical protein O6H91_14G075000 [Diphasiastrum complanatum]